MRYESRPAVARAGAGSAARPRRRAAAPRGTTRRRSLAERPTRRWYPPFHHTESAHSSVVTDAARSEPLARPRAERRVRHLTRAWAYPIVIAACALPRLGVLLHERESILSNFEKSKLL